MECLYLLKSSVAACQCQGSRLSFDEKESLSLISKIFPFSRWLDSSLSIMEQGVREFDTLCLRYKYYSFYDLNSKYDANRINQIYEQARWQILNEEIDCTEEEMMLFAALQLQVKNAAEKRVKLETNVQVAMQANVPQPNHDDDEGDDVDEELKKLQMSLEGGTGGGGWGDVTEDPSIADYLQYFK